MRSCQEEVAKDINFRWHSVVLFPIGFVLCLRETREKSGIFRTYTKMKTPSASAAHSLNQRGRFDSKFRVLWATGLAATTCLAICLERASEIPISISWDSKRRLRPPSDDIAVAQRYRKT